MGRSSGNYGKILRELWVGVPGCPLTLDSSNIFLCFVFGYARGGAGQVFNIQALPTPWYSFKHTLLICFALLLRLQSAIKTPYIILTFKIRFSFMFRVTIYKTGQFKVDMNKVNIFINLIRLKVHISVIYRSNFTFKTFKIEDCIW